MPGRLPDERAIWARYWTDWCEFYMREALNARGLAERHGAVFPPAPASVVAAIEAGPAPIPATHPDAVRYGKKHESPGEFALRIAYMMTMYQRGAAGENCDIGVPSFAGTQGEAPEGAAPTPLQMAVSLDTMVAVLLLDGKIDGAQARFLTRIARMIEGK